MLQAAIVGLGRWGRTLVDAVQDISPDIRFAAGYTRTRAKADAYCRSKGIRLADSYEDILQDRDIDAVVLATPHSLHAAQIEQAALAGKHIFVEKPFTLESAGARAALSATTAAGIVLAVGFKRRFHPSMAELRRRVRTGQLGVINSVVAEMTTTVAFSRPERTWRNDSAEEPAGALAGLAIHHVDSMIDLFGRMTEVYCVTQRRAAAHGDDTTSLLVRFESGVTGLAYTSLAACRNFRLAVYGSQGIAEILKPDMETFRLTPVADAAADRLRKAAEPEIVASPDFDTVAAELCEFAACIRDRRPFPIPPADILHGVEVFEAAVRSADTGAPVALAR